jgi:hypothetical protein
MADAGAATADIRALVGMNAVIRLEHAEGYPAIESYLTNFYISWHQGDRYLGETEQFHLQDGQWSLVYGTITDMWFSGRDVDFIQFHFQVSPSLVPWKGTLYIDDVRFF